MTTAKIAALQQIQGIQRFFKSPTVKDGILSCHPLFCICSFLFYHIMELFNRVSDTTHFTYDTFLNGFPSNKHRAHIFCQHTRLHHQFLQTGLWNPAVLTYKARDTVLDLLKIVESLLYANHHAA